MGASKRTLWPRISGAAGLTANPSYLIYLNSVSPLHAPPSGPLSAASVSVPTLPFAFMDRIMDKPRVDSAAEPAFCITRPPCCA